MKINTKLFTAFFSFVVIVVLFGINIIIEFDDINHIDHEIKQAKEISIAALDFNVENFHTQLEVWEYAYEPNQKRLAAFESHQNTLDELLTKWQDIVLEEEESVGESFHALYPGAIADMYEITQNLKLVEDDWTGLLVAIGEYHTAVDEGASDAEIKRLDSIVLEKVNTNEALFDELQFNNKVDQFVINQGNLIDNFEAARNQIISNSINTLYVIITVIVIIGLILGYFISKSITTPIRKLKDGSIQLAKGKFTKLEISGNDELTDLTKSFNRMASEILQSKIIITENLVSMERQASKLNATYNKLKKSELLKEEFSLMITHELKTPLTPIRGYCEILKDESFGTLTKDQISYVEKIDSSAVLLERLISDVLDVQKLDMEKMSFNKESFDACNFLDRLKQDYSCIMKDKGIEFVVTNSVKTTLKTDQLRLQQVLENLIRNSVDFVPSKNGKIEVGIKQENGKMIFHVKDNGIGIPKDKQQNIFKKFYQVDTSHTRKHGGTGLGLVICRGIVNALGGEIWFESEPGKGTTFYFLIPICGEKITVEIPC